MLHWRAYASKPKWKHSLCLVQATSFETPSHKIALQPRLSDSLLPLTAPIFRSALATFS